MKTADEKFVDMQEVVDGKDYANCTFERCRIIYRGGPVPSIVGCTFRDCGWQFEEAAERTLLFLRLLYHGLGPAGGELVESALRQVREPMPNG